MTYFQAELNSALIPHAQRRDERLILRRESIIFRVI